MCRQIDKAAREALWHHLSAIAIKAKSAYQVQHDLQEMMQDNVGIVRREDEMQAGAGRY